MAIADEQSRYNAVVERVENIVRSRWPDARFRVTSMPDAEGVAVWTYCDGDFWDVTALTSDAEYQAMDREGLYVYVIPMPSEAWTSEVN